MAILYSPHLQNAFVNTQKRRKRITNAAVGRMKQDIRMIHSSGQLFGIRKIRIDDGNRDFLEPLMKMKEESTDPNGLVLVPITSKPE